MMKPAEPKTGLRSFRREDVKELNEIADLIEEIHGGSHVPPVDNLTAEGTSTVEKPPYHDLTIPTFTVKDTQEWNARVKKQMMTVVRAAEFTNRTEKEFNKIATEIENMAALDIDLQEEINYLEGAVDEYDAALDERAVEAETLKKEIISLHKHKENATHDMRKYDKQIDGLIKSIAGMSEAHEQALMKYTAAQGNRGVNQLEREWFMMQRLLLERQADIERTAEQGYIANLNALRRGEQYAWADFKDEDTLGKLRATRKQREVASSTWYNERRRLGLVQPIVRKKYASVHRPHSRPTKEVDHEEEGEETIQEEGE